MEKVVAVKVPVEWLEELQWDESAVVREIIQLGTYQFRHSSHSPQWGKPESSALCPAELCVVGLRVA